MTDQRKEVINQLHELNILLLHTKLKGHTHTDRATSRHTSMQRRSGTSWRATAATTSQKP